MPIARMKKLIGAGSSDERNKLLKLLTKFGCVEISQSTEIAGTDAIGESVYYDEVSEKLAKLSFADNFIKEQKNQGKKLAKAKKIEYKPDKKDFLVRKPEIDYDIFADCNASEHEVFDKIDALLELNDELIELKSAEAKARAAIEQVRLYANLPVKFSDIADTKNTVALLGFISARKADELTALTQNIHGCVIDSYIEGNNIIVVAIALKESAEELNAALADLEFTQTTYNFNSTAAEIIAQNEIKIKETQYRHTEIIEEVLSKYKDKEYMSKIRLMQDFYNVEMQKVKAVGGMRKTKSTYFFEGWIPEGAAELVGEKLEKSPYALAYIIRDVEEGDDPPTYCINNGIVTPYQGVTNMYSVPSYNEINPNPFVTFFFVLFFGIMISDAGYGVLMTLGAGFVLWRMKPRKNELGLVKIILMGGISSIFWGILFGGYFGIEQDVLKPLLFNPLQDPMNMLILSLGLGFVQMFTGMGINAYQLFKKKQPLDAIFGVFSWYVLFIGLAMFALGGKIVAVKYTGIALLAAGLLGLMLGGALHKKGFKKVSGAFSNLYNIINFFSDLLSYTRLFGLGLATGVIALVFNNIAMVFIDINVYLGSILAVIILLVGHLFNIGINTLGAYVHNSRLQFVEFFGKFYEGGGHLFAPLGNSMKHYNFIQEESK